MKSFDAIVLGTGGVGSAALYQLARRGARVLGVDPFPAGHDRGSSHGHTRIIRQAYFEHADYVPLLLRAYTLWREFEQLTGQQLFYQVGLLEVGPSTGQLLTGVRRSAQQHRLAIENLTARDVTERFPGFHVPDNMEAVFEPTAGYLMVEQAVRAHIQAAVAAGAELLIGQRVRQFRPHGGGIEVVTEEQSFVAGCLVITAGAWARELIGVDVPLRVVRKHLHWYATTDNRYDAEHGCPTFLYEMPEGHFYGFPSVEDRGVKVGEHSGGETVGDPNQLDRSLDVNDRQRVERFLTGQLPHLAREHSGHAVCMYTLTPDEHFIVDTHPQMPRVAFAAGLSGHGFKFAPALGQALADLALEGHTELPIGFLGRDRVWPTKSID